MTPELWAALIGALVLLLTNLAGLIKVWTDLSKTKSDRQTTKQTRDADSQELHDTVLKLSFQVDQNKNNIGLLFDQMTDQLKQIGLLNTQLAQVLTKMDALCDAIKELKEEVKDK